MTTTELKNIAPKLTEIKNHHHGFDIPTGYFNKLEAEVFKKIETDEALLRSVPEEYFDTIENRVFKKIKKEYKVISLKNRLLKIAVPIAIAASILLVITLQLSNSKQEDLFANIKTSDIENWIESGDLELTEYEINVVYKGVNYDNLDFNYTEEDLDNLNSESLIY